MVPCQGAFEADSKFNPNLMEREREGEKER